MIGMDKYLKQNPDKKNYNLGRKYNNTLSGINKSVMKTQYKTDIIYYEKDKEDNIIGMVVRVSTDEFKYLTKDLFFCFPAPLGEPYQSTILDGAIIEDIINSCDPSLGVDMESDPDVAKLKLRLKLSQLGWEIDDVAK